MQKWYSRTYGPQYNSGQNILRKQQQNGMKSLHSSVHSARLFKLTVSFWGVVRHLQTGSGLDDWIYWHLIHSQLGTTANTALSLIYTLYSSPLHTHYGSQPSLVVTRQRIYNILIVTSNHTWSFFSPPNSLLAIILQLPTQFNSSAPKLISREIGVSKLDWLLQLNSLHGPRRKHSPSTVGMASLQFRSIATEVTRFLLAYSLPREYVYRGVA
jgi:hypothetical protein